MAAKKYGSAAFTKNVGTAPGLKASKVKTSAKVTGTIPKPAKYKKPKTVFPKTVKAMEPKGPKYPKVK